MGAAEGDAVDLNGDVGAGDAGAAALSDDSAILKVDFRYTRDEKSSRDLAEQGILYSSVVALRQAVPAVQRVVVWFCWCKAALRYAGKRSISQICWRRTRMNPGCRANQRLDIVSSAGPFGGTLCIRCTQDQSRRAASLSPVVDRHGCMWVFLSFCTHSSVRIQLLLIRTNAAEIPERTEYSRRKGV